MQGIFGRINRTVQGQARLSRDSPHSNRSLRPGSATLLFNRNPCVIARLLGGVGNQLFIYSTARALALRNCVPLYLDADSGYASDPFRRRPELDAFCIDFRRVPRLLLTSTSFSGKAYRRTLKFVNGFLPTRSRCYMVEPRSDGPALLRHFRCKGPVFLDGHWQTEEYFSDCREELAVDLRFRQDFISDDSRVSDRLRSPLAVCVHIRRYDEVDAVSGTNAGSAMRLHEAYFREAISLVRAQLPDAQFFVFCDNVAWARSKFPENESIQIASTQAPSHPCLDLWLMSLCRHHILSNSTYSWWGRWLNHSEDGLVVAPATRRWGLRMGVPRLPTGWKALSL